jgi:hypothetical protein
VTDSEKLLQARQLIEEVQGNLNKKTKRCESCGYHHSENSPQRIQWEMLEAAITRLAKVDDWIKRESNKTELERDSG